MKPVLLLMAFAFLLTACKTKIDTKLNVVEDLFIVQTKDSEKLRLPKGELKGKLVIDGKNPKNSHLTLFLRKNNKKFRPDVPLKLPKLDVLLGSNDPIRLDAKDIGQSFGMMVMREVRPKKDRFIMTFHDPEFNQDLGEMIFEYEPSKVLYDEDKKQFLASYQKVKRKHRALVVKIDGAVDTMIDLGKKLSWLEKTIDHIVNYGGAALISPWAYARYSKISWLVGSSYSYNENSKWKEVVNDYPVIDYFAFVHSGYQHLDDRDAAVDLGMKKNQLRVVYTGACNSKHGSE